MNRSPNRRIRMIMLGGAVIDVLAMLLIHVGMDLQTGLGGMGLLSRYRELHNAGVIQLDREALAEYREGELDHDPKVEWDVMPRHLFEGYSPAVLKWSLTGLLAAHLLLMLFGLSIAQEPSQSAVRDCAL